MQIDQATLVLDRGVPNYLIQLGLQVAWIPGGACNVKDPRIQYGFITGFGGRGMVFCRYFLNHRSNKLRTEGCSESTPISCLVPFMSHPQCVVTEWLIALGYLSQGGLEHA